MKRSLSPPVLILLAGLSCTKKITQAGGLELLLMSDLPASDLNKVHLEVSQETAPGEWHKVFDRDAFVHDPPEISLPTTASIAAGESPSQGALIVFTGMKESLENGRLVARKIVERVVQTQVPTDRVAELKMLLTSPCVGMVTACNFGESCQPESGTCGPNKVDSSTLPTYGAGDESTGSDLTGGPAGFGGNAGGFVGGAGSPGSGGMTGSGGASLGKGGQGGIVGETGGVRDIGAGPAPCAISPKAVVTSSVLSDFESTPSDVVTAVNPTGRWFSYQDIAGSMITPVTGAWMVESPGNGGTGRALHVRGTLPPIGPTQIGASVGFSLSNSIPGGPATTGNPGGPATGNGMVTRPTDVSSYAGISFYSKGSSIMYVQFATPSNDPSYCTCTILGDCGEHFVYLSMTADWTQHTVRFADLHQRSNVAFDPSSLLSIKFAAGVMGAVDFWIDDVTLIH